jgi:predicted acylesterase/phospholipase RssA
LDENAPTPTICEAALATSAATKFFDPVFLGDRQFVDGAFGANNPVEEVEEEACDIWCPATRNLQDLTKCLISIGTGHAGKQALDDNLFKFLSKTLVRMATKPAGVERRFMARWRRECTEKRCFRFNVEEGLENVHMADYQKRSLIETATHDYLHHPMQKSLIRDCMLNLARKKSMYLHYHHSLLDRSYSIPSGFVLIFLKEKRTSILVLLCRYLSIVLLIPAS